MQTMLKNLPAVQGVFRERFDPGIGLSELAAGFSGAEGTVFLVSGGDLDCSRYSMLAAAPWLSITARGERLEIVTDDLVISLQQDPFLVVDAILDRCRLPETEASSPVAAGLFGYFAYDLKDRIEDLPRTCIGHSLPDLALYAPSILLVEDRQTRETTLHIPRLFSKNAGISPDQRVRETRAALMDMVATVSGQEADNDARAAAFSIDAAGLVSNFKKNEYTRTIERIIDYIKAGDIYQVNMSQRFETGFEGDPYALFQALFANNPAPFFAYVNAGDHQVISTSPERFISRRGEDIETRPIKGTIARGKDPDEDARLGQELLNSFKDDAELSMIVDLLRNDLGRVAAGGSVQVREHKRLEPYTNVFHLVSVVEARLREDVSPMDILRATFPGGSITGCPKIRSMEIIDELEPVKRHVYTGSIGYVSFHDTMDLSIAIRTATVYQGRLFFSVGGGIVFDSNPENEYLETLHKGRTLMETLVNQGGAIRRKDPVAWVSGRLVPEREACVPAAAFGVQYGAGFFETIRVDNGRPRNLDEHVQRMNTGWRLLFEYPAPDITWHHVIDRLILENALENETAAVKLIVAQGRSMSGHAPDIAAAFARPYTHRLETANKSGLDLVTYPGFRQMPLADFKTLNYLYCYQAGVYAKINRADEALILNPDGTISETNTCNLMSVREDSIVVPVSDHVLAGVTQELVKGILEKQGYAVERRRITPDEFFESGRPILTNALIGAVPALSIDGRPLPDSVGLCRGINEILYPDSSR